MNLRQATAGAILAALLAGCSSAGSSYSPLAPHVTAVRPKLVQPLSPIASQVADIKTVERPKHARLTVRIRIPRWARGRRARYISAATKAMTFDFEGRSHVTESVALTPSDPRCSGRPLTCVLSFSLTAGSYNVTVKAYDKAPVGGAIPSNAKLLSIASNVAEVIHAGKSNKMGVTLAGVPSTLAVTGMPSAQWGVAYPSAQPFTVSARDADANLIVGPYDSPITLHDSDSSGATTVVTSGGDHPAAGTLLSSSDTAAINYGGQHVAPPSITATASGATQSVATFPSNVAAKIAIGAMPSGAANSAFPNPQSFTVSAKDSNGETLTGSYFAPIVLTDSDTSGATAIVTSGSDSPPAGEMISATDAAALTYTGLAIAQATITASSSGASNASSTFTPTLMPISPNGGADALNPSFLGTDLYANTGTGSTVNRFFVEYGWTNYSKPFTAKLTGCANIATVAQDSNAEFTLTAVASPSPGSCTLTVSDGAGQTLNWPVYYTGFAYTGAAQSFTLPSAVSKVTIQAAGAAGGADCCGSGAGGQGGLITATVGVTGVLGIYVGGQGQENTVSTGGGAGGFNGGASSGTYSGGMGGGGGGASDVRTGGTALSNRVVIAGGGGGAGSAFGDETGSSGGPGGGTTGGDGVADSVGGCANGGGGGTPSAGGPAGTGSGHTGIAGLLGLGGTGGDGGAGSDPGLPGGGGGGGYYGGGGGAGSDDISCGGGAAGGGGGSSYATNSATGVTNSQGGNSGNGYVTIAF